MRRERKPFSLKWGLTAVMAACWVIPIVTIVIVAGVLLNRNYEQSLRESITASVGHAMEQTTLQLDNAMEASKAVSYNGDIREALGAMKANLDRRAGQAEPAEESETQQQAENFLVNQAIAYIRAHYREKLSLQEVADRCYISQWHLSKQLNRCAGKSFYDILNSVRIEEACKLLADPSLKIGEISELVGYADVAHFARTFKKLEGVSANEYRNKLQLCKLNK